MAVSLEVSSKTVLRWCQLGKIPAQPVLQGSRVTYKIPVSCVELVRTQLANKKTEQVNAKSIEQKPHQDFEPAWIKAMKTGMIAGKPYSTQTVEDYKWYLSLYWAKHSEIKAKHLQSDLVRIPAHQFSKRFHYFHAVLAFAKFLESKAALSEDEIQRMKALKPKRHLPPKRKTVDADSLQKIHLACKTLQEWLIILLLSQTGLRASEACQLQWEDVDLGKGILTVRLGKGNKSRRVGFGVKLADAFQCHLSTLRLAKGFILLDKFGKPMTRYGLNDRVRRIGKRVSVEMTPHALRRAFVTLNANQGRPIQMLQLACGHSSIKTTMGYVMTQEQEVIEAMKGWA